MSMIRELRAVVRPALRKDNRPGYGFGYERVGAATSSAVVDCGVYLDGRRDTEQLTPAQALRKVRSPEGQGRRGFVWIGLHEPTEEEFSGIAQEYGLHPLAVEDAVHAHQRPKLERYDESLFTVFKTVHYVEHAELTASSEVVETGEVMCFTGRDYIITVRHGGQGSLRALRHRLEDDPELLGKGPSAVLHAIADQTVDGYLAVADAVQDDIDEVEIDVFSDRSGNGKRGGDAGRIYQLKREVLEFKRAVSPLMRPLQTLSERPVRLVRPGHPEVLPRRGRPPDPGQRAGAGLRRPAQLDPPGEPRPGDGRAERGHAEDHRLGRHLRGADHDRRDLRHELRLHARDRVDVRLSGGAAADRRHLLRHPPGLQAQRVAVACGL